MLFLYLSFNQFFVFLYFYFFQQHNKHHPKRISKQISPLKSITQNQLCRNRILQAQDVDEFEILR